MSRDETEAQVDSAGGVRWLGWADWRTTVLLMLGILAVRMIYLVWLSPWELLEDEAQYWDWSRRLGLSYYSKGPGVAWLIAASTAIFGVSEWAVRLPAALSSLVAALVLARLTIDATGDARAGFLAAVAFNLIPIFQVQALLMTIDPPFVALWLICAWIAWHAFRAHHEQSSAWWLWLLLGLALGAGFLVKYVIVLLPPGLLVYALLFRRTLPWDRRFNMAIVLALVGFLVAITPWIIWNSQHGWPAIAHELGHLGAPGGDIPPKWDEPHGIPSMFELLGAQVGILGPPAFVLLLLATIHAFKRRGERPERWPRHSFMLCCGLPTLAFLPALAADVSAGQLAGQRLPDTPRAAGREDRGGSPAVA
jgi:4-amino-4-deoxy-L-arabinose transferase-like glycosyltransferase